MTVDEATMTTIAAVQVTAGQNGLYINDSIRMNGQTMTVRCRSIKLYGLELILMGTVDEVLHGMEEMGRGLRTTQE